MINLDSLLSNVCTVGISGHVRPDGDCVGSTLAVYNFIKKEYPNLTVELNLESIPHVFDFLTGSDEINHDYIEGKEYDLYFALDCGDTGRLGAFATYFENAKKTVCIDHHVSNQAFADENYIVGDASSTCELVCNLLDDSKITKEIAECLYTGMVHDTGVFQYSCTSSKTMEIAGRLMDKGIDYPKIIDDTFYTKTFEQNKVLGYALMNSQLLCDGKIIASYVSQEKMKEYHVVPKHLDGIVSQLRVTKDVRVAVFVYENEDGTKKVSLRANGNIDVAKVAMNFGGGGHVKAAGCTMDDSIESIYMKLTEEIQKQMDE